jgi:hypothetical protein
MKKTFVAAVKFFIFDISVWIIMIMTSARSLLIAILRWYSIYPTASTIETMHSRLRYGAGERSS